jgi:hypothetical protein
MVTLMGSQQVTMSTKDKYLRAIEKRRERILEIYWRHEEKKPVLLFDVTEGKIYVYPYKKFKKGTEHWWPGIANQAV